MKWDRINTYMDHDCKDWWSISNIVQFYMDLSIFDNLHWWYSYKTTYKVITKIKLSSLIYYSIEEIFKNYLLELKKLYFF